MGCEDRTEEKGFSGLRRIRWWQNRSQKKQHFRLAFSRNFRYIHFTHAGDRVLPTPVSMISHFMSSWLLIVDANFYVLIVVRLSSVCTRIEPSWCGIYLHPATLYSPKPLCFTDGDTTLFILLCFIRPCRNVSICYDPYHLVSNMNEVVDDIRRSEKRNDRTKIRYKINSACIESMKVEIGRIQRRSCGLFDIKYVFLKLRQSFLLCHNFSDRKTWRSPFSFFREGARRILPVWHTDVMQNNAGYVVY